MVFGYIILFLFIIEKTFSHRLFCYFKIYFTRVSKCHRSVPWETDFEVEIACQRLTGRVLGNNTCKRAREAGTGWGRGWMGKELQRRTQPIPQGASKLGKLFKFEAVLLYSDSTLALTNHCLWAASLSKGNSWGRLSWEPLAVEAPGSWMSVSVLKGASGQYTEVFDTKRQVEGLILSQYLPDLRIMNWFLYILQR